MKRRLAIRCSRLRQATWLNGSDRLDSRQGFGNSQGQGPATTDCSVLFSTSKHALTLSLCQSETSAMRYIASRVQLARCFAECCYDAVWKGLPPLHMLPDTQVYSDAYSCLPFACRHATRTTCSNSMQPLCTQSSYIRCDCNWAFADACSCQPRYEIHCTCHLKPAGGNVVSEQIKWQGPKTRPWEKHSGPCCSQT